ncbi:COX assembly mitochondrial protein [Lamellibrachia satsuma]|nr:COX assembly mitochondrial protein [Lamellibrachia satsuma]
MTDTKRKSSVLPDSMGGGPMGLGDPDNRSLRHVETDILIPKIVKEVSREKCSDLIKEFSVCGKQAGFMLPFKCRKQNKAMQECLLKWFQDPEVNAKCREQYLKDRADYRRTGVGHKIKRYEI